MVINSANFVGANILKDKKKIAKVKDLIINPESKGIMAFILADDSKEDKALLFKDIKQINPDEMVIENDNNLKNAKDLITHNGKQDYIKKEKVITEDQEELGEVREIFFDTESGEVKKVVVSDSENGSSQILINVEDIVKMKDNYIIVKKQNSKEQNKDGKSEKLIMETKQKAEDTYGKIKSKLTN